MQALQIIYVFGYPLQTGGHFKSALSMVRKLEAMGHHVIVLAAPGGAEEIGQEFTGTGAEFITVAGLKKYIYFPSVFGARRIVRIAKEHLVDIIHAQDFLSVGPAYLASILLGSVFVYTKAGGPFTHELPPKAVDTVIFSQELMDALPKAYRLIEDNLHLIRARIDRDVYKPEEVNSAFVREYGLGESGKKVVMAMRLAWGKKAWLKAIMEAAESLAASSTDVCIVIAGDGPLLPMLRERAAQINRKSKDGPVLHFIGPIVGLKEINQFYNYGDVVAGSGRGILEAMACRKPVVVLGENGEGEVVGPENIENIAYFNFSGRHFRHRSNPAGSLPLLLKDLLRDENRQRQLGDYSCEYIRTQMDARIGAEQLLDVYQKALNKRSSLIDYAEWSVRAICAGITGIGPAIRKRVFLKRFC